MKKNKPFTKSALASALFTFALALLANYNLEKNYRPGEYVAAEGGYFVEKIDDPAGLVKAKKFVTPTDNKYNDQKTRSLGSNLIGDIESVWSSYTGVGTTIAIIDDGFDYNHPEFTRADGSSAILPTSRYYYTSGSTVYYSHGPSNIRQDWESNGKGGYEWSTHGTATSTTAAAPMNNAGGVGVAPDANILALKIDFYLSSINAAIEYAIEQKVDVINMSLGAYAETFTDGWGDLQTGNSSTATYLNNATSKANQKGIIVVAAAGNEATWRKSYPASNTGVIGVGAIGDWDNKGNPNQLAEFTNYVGASQTGEVNVDILAPGYVYTAHQKGTQSSPTHTYADTQGTSFSSPIVAGAAALWKQKYPNGTPGQFLDELQDTADGKGSYANKMIPVSGWDSSLSDVGPSNITNGRINVANLLDIGNPYVTPTQSSINIATGERKQIKLATSNGTITYSSANSNIASVSNTGLIEGVGTGSTSITITANKDGKTATASINVTVSEAIAMESLTFNPNQISLNLGETYDAEATIETTPSDASRLFLFDSGDDSVATVDEDTGLVTAVGVGTTEIEVIAIDGDGYDTLSVTVQNTIPQTGVLNFGSANGSLNVNSASKSGTDSLNNPWLVTTTGTTSFTPNSTYSQLGSSKSPASTIEFKMTLTSPVTFTNVSASFGGFGDSQATVTIKVGSIQIGVGSVSSNTDTTTTNSLTASGNILTISLTNISKGIKAYSISYSYNGGGPVEPPTLAEVQVINTKTYHPGEIISKNDINVTLAYSDGSASNTTDFTFANDGYQFTYDDASSGGSTTSKQFTVIYDGDSYNFSVNVTRAAYVPASGQTKTIGSSQFNSSNISKSTDTPSNPNVTIDGVGFTVSTNAYIFSQSGYYLSFGKGKGSINNTNGFTTDLTSVSVVQKSGARQDGSLMISKNGISWVSYSENEIAKGGYRYFKYEYTSTSSASGAAGYSNIQSITYTLSGQDSAAAVANYIMFADTNDQCLTKLPLALEKLNNMNSANINEFWTSEEFVIATARERLLAWARHEGMEIVYSNDSFVISNTNNASSLLNGQTPDFFSLMILSFFGLITISGYLIIKRKKHH